MLDGVDMLFYIMAMPVVPKPGHWSYSIVVCDLAGMDIAFSWMDLPAPIAHLAPENNAHETTI